MITRTNPVSRRFDRRTPFINVPATEPTTLATSETAHDSDKFAELLWQVESTAAIAELLHRVVAARSLDNAALIVVNELSAFLQADSVAIGLVDKRSLRVKVVAMSDVAQVDPTAETTKLFSAAMSESLLRGRELNVGVTVRDTASLSCELMQISHDELLHRTSAQFALSCPLCDADSNVIGVWIATFQSPPLQSERMIRFASAIKSPLAETFRSTQQATEGVFARLDRSFRDAKASTRRKRLAIGAAILFGAMFIPIPHRVACHCVLQSTSQRFAVAPHDGILKNIHMRAGDRVHKGQLLAEMEATDLELEIADVTARQQRAFKQADIHQSENDPTATQLARLEASELTAELDLLKYRLARQQITSDIDGLVLQCELDDAEGAPVRRGDVLLEIAPLDSMRVELEIPEHELSHVAIGQTVQMIVDGIPLDPLNAGIERIRPMSEVRNGQNVFIAEVSLTNDSGDLRPGMQGQTKISAGYRAAGWVYLHRAWERLYGCIR
jgi:multidrug resistance efflux pump